MPKPYGRFILNLDAGPDSAAQAAIRAFEAHVRRTDPIRAQQLRARYDLAPPAQGLVSARHQRNESVDLTYLDPRKWPFPVPRTWHSGPPPHIGWWNASNQRRHTVWRWWDGHHWSFSLSVNSAPGSVAKVAALKVRKHHVVSSIEWTDYWPENARVPRTPTPGTKWRLRDTGEVFTVTEVNKSGMGAFIHAEIDDGSGCVWYRGYYNWFCAFDPVEGK